MNKRVLTGLLTLAVSIGMTGIATAQTQSETYSRSITLGQVNDGKLSFDNLDKGDMIRLTLTNPSSQSQVFTVDHPFGPKQSWVIPARSQRTVSYQVPSDFGNRISFDTKQAQYNDQGQMIGSAEQDNGFDWWGFGSDDDEVQVQQGQSAVRGADGNVQVDEPLFGDAQQGEDYFRRRVVLQQGMTGEIIDEDLGVGDQVILELVNPTNQALTFTTTQQLGAETSWLIPANTTKLVEFTYQTPFSDDVEYVVYDTYGQRISSGALMNIDDPAFGNLQAGEDYFRRTITLQPGMGEINIDDLGVGDTLVLTLVNPTGQQLNFQTTERLGDEMMWSVPANSQRTITYEYTQPFDDDVEYMVSTSTGQHVSEGTLIQGSQPGSQRGTAVRGYW